MGGWRLYRVSVAPLCSVLKRAAPASDAHAGPRLSAAAHHTRPSRALLLVGGEGRRGGGAWQKRLVDLPPPPNPSAASSKARRGPGLLLAFDVAHMAHPAPRPPPGGVPEVGGKWTKALGLAKGGAGAWGAPKRV